MEGTELKAILMQMVPFVHYVQSWSSSPLPPPFGDMTGGGRGREHDAIRETCISGTWPSHALTLDLVAFAFK